MVPFKSLTFQLKCLSDSDYLGIIDTVNHNNSIWVLGESLMRGSLPTMCKNDF